MKLEKFVENQVVILINGQHGVVREVSSGRNKNYYNVYVPYDNAVIKVFAADMKLATD